jgi:hypothetical protein
MNGAWSYEDAEEEIRAAGYRPNGHAPEAPIIIRATPFVWIDPAALPKREWLYGRHLIRPFLQRRSRLADSAKAP